ncbi:MAG: glutamate--tRNA ligase family protein [Flavobacteriales bacterium]
MPRTRIAPTPSGYLHTGNAVNFLLTRLLAMADDGDVLLRIDDLDQERVRPEYVEDIFHQLERLGIQWDRGSRNSDEHYAYWSQQFRLPLYHGLIAELRTARALFACTCSRSTMEHCECALKGTGLDEPDVTWRLRIPNTCPVTFEDHSGPRTMDLAQLMHPPVIRQRNGRPAYQVASLADDLHFGIDLIVRGEDLLPSTACQVYIAHLLGHSAFCEARFIHHRLLLDAMGNKLSKSAGAEALAHHRSEQPDVDALRKIATSLLTELR